ncbi:hypothetical protein LCGC14_0085940 [marine sediment metagenome]|uniref:Class II aldolase/adducin N-terminal domain-containing protein n=1 Tax=marine sediment metagenome TaxID=412755 RepID=A0A0F9VGG5_9ZZZZ|nr:class II aldolase/adducin family protein [Halomonas sp.]MCL5426405.1 class II aldolase/adducin family protein [Gammaproteobacteria bacterium]HDZ46300.1 class II aldolase/adducin family protein [Halomonas sp.]HEB04751.1 class II aldolase/adducin family protein [Halomonas sp.]
MPNITPEQDALLNDLVDANHILFNEGVVDAFGHVSVRHPENPEQFILSRNRAPGLVEKEDLMIFNLDGQAVNDNRKPYLERFIHGEIYRKRPDVMSIVHSHSASVVPFSVLRNYPLRAMCHMSGFIGEGAPIFEIREAGGNATDLLISSQHLGSALADSLADHPLILMRGHGSTVVADSLKKAVYRAVYVEVNARAQTEASRLGKIEFLTKEEAATAMNNIEGQADRPWQLWKLRARKARDILLAK